MLAPNFWFLACNWIHYSNSGIVAQELLDDAERRVAGSPSRTTCLPLAKRIPSAKITVDC
ncbi:MAG: hypothetical protein DMG73_01490 [Acidobacteria bacterium]|nr:MAG: hypothetical protein DMG73_01490 [Acidobacteriota bacterium]